MWRARRRAGQQASCCPPTTRRARIKACPGCACYMGHLCLVDVERKNLREAGVGSVAAANAAGVCCLPAASCREALLSCHWDIWRQPATAHNDKPWRESRQRLCACAARGCHAAINAAAVAAYTDPMLVSRLRRVMQALMRRKFACGCKPDNLRRRCSLQLCGCIVQLTTLF